MSSSRLKTSTSSPMTPGSFLAEWCDSKLPTYVHDFGGPRAGVPKGADIPFPPHKVKAAVALLAYGSPHYETLQTIARSIRVSSSLLRLWRTEERFLALYRRAVWECADDYVDLLAKSWDDKRPSPSDEFSEFFGVALQQALLRRLWVDVIQREPDWTTEALKPKWQSEVILVGSPPTAPPPFTKDQILMITHNANLLLASSVTRLGVREPGLANWASFMWLKDLSMMHLVRTDLRAAVEAGNQKAALELINFVTAPSPVDDWRRLQQLLQSSTRKARRHR